MRYLSALTILWKRPQAVVTNCPIRGRRWSASGWYGIHLSACRWCNHLIHQPWRKTTMHSVPVYQDSTETGLKVHLYRSTLSWNNWLLSLFSERRDKLWSDYFENETKEYPKLHALLQDVRKLSYEIHVHADTARTILFRNVWGTANKIYYFWNIPPHVSWRT